AVLDRVATDYAEKLAPAIERVWHDEIDELRRDLGIWVQKLADDQVWKPEYFEFSFGLSDEGRDPRSVAEPIVIDDGFILRGSVDLIEEHARTGVLRVTDHKTGKNRSNPDLVVGGGAMLQGVLYSVAVERALGKKVVRGRYYYATTIGGFVDKEIEINDDLDDTLIVEAAAGTGKTTELVNRILRILASGRATMVEIVAVTFTEKAAGELKLRLREALERERAAAANEEVRLRLELALETLEEAHVNTIHGFRAELLRERPVEACVDPLFVVLTDVQADRLYARAFRAWLQEALENPPEGLRRALRRTSFPAFGVAAESNGPIDRLRTAGRMLADWRDFPHPQGGRLQVREGREPHRRPRRARSAARRSAAVPQGRRRGSRRLPAAGAGRRDGAVSGAEARLRFARLRRSPCARARSHCDQCRCSRAPAAEVHAHLRRRVPGHRPAPGRHPSTARRRRPRQAVHRRRSEAGDLSLSRNRCRDVLDCARRAEGARRPRVAAHDELPQRAVDPALRQCRLLGGDDRQPCDAAG